jgi:hypothetical protein
VALGYVRTHLDAFGIAGRDLRTLAFAGDYVDVIGTHHLTWTQRADGIEVFHAGLRAAVTDDGRLVTVVGPVARGVSRARPRFDLTSRAALRAARRSAGIPASRSTAMDEAHRVWFPTPLGVRPAWETRTFVRWDRIDSSVIDARTGRVLDRRNMVQAADQVGSGLAWGYYPSTAVPGGGGSQTPVTFPVAGPEALSGNNAHVFTDVRGGFEFEPRPKDEVTAADPSTLDWSDPAVLDTSTADQHCSPEIACTWDRETPYSWRENRRASAANTYWLLNHFHDHLESAPIGFTEAAGNFQVVNDDGQGGEDGDPVLAAGLLGASESRGLPGPVNNAFMGTPPDGESPVMGMFLFEEARYPKWVPFGPEIPSSDAGVDASVVYHEYTHGLSNRLVIYPDGQSALDSLQAYTMGEAWSDWYALDLLEAEGFIDDTPAVDVREGQYITGGPGIRYQAADCRVDSPIADCPAPPGGAGPGGYTYADFGHVDKYGWEPHSDGEIWVQTLWDLRDALGSADAEMLVTRAMELSPPGPSFLDMRNAILEADQVAFGGANEDTIWGVFAGRGMGFFAESDGGDDVQPDADFSLPPTCPGDAACGRIEGAITDPMTGAGVAGITVEVGASSGIPIDLSAVTAGDGSYTIGNVPFHDYDAVTVTGPGYDLKTIHDVDVTGTVELSTQLARDWAALSGGASVERVGGRDFTDFGCGVAQAFDGDPATQWLTRPVHHALPFAVVRLPQAVRVGRVGIAPAGCFRAIRLRRFAVFTRTEDGEWKRAVSADRSMPSDDITYFTPDRGIHRVVEIRLVLRAAEGRNARHGLIGLADLFLRGTPSA